MKFTAEYLIVCFSAFQMRASELSNHSLSLFCPTEGLGAPNLFEHVKHVRQLLILIKSIPCLVYQTSLLTAMQFIIGNILFPVLDININLILNQIFFCPQNGTAYRISVRDHHQFNEPHKTSSIPCSSFISRNIYILQKIQIKCQHLSKFSMIEIQII